MGGPLSAWLVLLLSIASAPPPRAATVTVFGDEIHARGSGTPVLVVSDFAVADPSAAHELVVHANGMDDPDSEGRLVSSAVITINGSLIVGPGHFRHRAAAIKEPVSLAARLA